MALVLAYLEPNLLGCGSLPFAPQNDAFTTVKGQIKHLSADSCTSNDQLVLRPSIFVTFMKLFKNAEERLFNVHSQTQIQP